MYFIIFLIYQSWCFKVCNKLNRFFLKRSHSIKPLRNFFITHLTNSTYLALNDLSYERFQDGVSWNSFNFVLLFIKRLGTQTKQKQKADSNIQGDLVIYKPEDSQIEQVYLRILIYILLNILQDRRKLSRTHARFKKFFFKVNVILCWWYG